MGGEFQREQIHTHVAKSLCCPPEIITTLLIGYIPKQNKKFRYILKKLFLIFTSWVTLNPVQWPQDWKRAVFIPIPKKGNAKECSNYRTIALISHTSKVMLKILQARLRQYVNRELTNVQVDLKRQRNPRSNCQHPLDQGKSKRVPEKHLLLLH